MNSCLKEKLGNFSFIFPALLIFSIFYIYPFFYTFFLSFQRYDMISKAEFVALANFKDVLFGQKWWLSVYNGAFITFWALTFQNILAFMLALAVDKVIRLRKFYRVVFFILPVLAEVIIGLLMRMLLDENVSNQLLTNLHLGFLARNWLSNDIIRLVAALVHCWKGFGWAFVILLAGLQTIPEQLYEAARIDGANSWHSFSKITIPLLMPVLALVIVLTILGTMQTFAMVLALTRGAGGITDLPVMRIYNHVRLNQAGLACAEGIILGTMLVIVSFTMLFISKKLREKYGVLSN